MSACKPTIAYATKGVQLTAIQQLVEWFDRVMLLDIVWVVKTVQAVVHFGRQYGLNHLNTAS